jgi:hypothetical protein
MTLPITNFLHPPLTSTLLDPNILLSGFYSNTLSLCSPLNAKEQVYTYTRLCNYSEADLVKGEDYIVTGSTAISVHSDAGCEFSVFTSLHTSSARNCDAVTLVDILK